MIDWVVALALSAYAVFLVSGAQKDNTRHAGAAAAIVVLAMTLPVAWRRPAPIAVAIVLGIGGIANYLIIGPMIRCGPALPALLLGATPSVASRPGSIRGRTALGIGFLLLSATTQCLTDPRLQPGVMVVMGPMIIGLFFVGLLVQSRNRMVVDLEQRNAELVHHRRRRAELAVEADRVRIAEGLDSALNAQIDEIGATAASGRAALMGQHSPEEAVRAFASIQQRGRDTLRHMRQVVGTLLDKQPPNPQPSLGQLDRLLERAGPATVHLHVTGQPRSLSPGVEVSAYRALEHLLDAYGKDVDRRIDIEVDFAAEALSLTVRGPELPSSEINSTLASIRARVEFLRGSLDSACPDGMWVD